MRIITKNNNTYYIDDNLKIMPVCNHYTASVIVMNGEIGETFINDDSRINPEDTTSFTLSQIFEFVQYLNTHQLWKYQIQQIYVNPDFELELVPRVGNHIIIFGSPNDFQYKLGKLEAIYKKGFAITDWNIYQSINLKYSDQVICKKR